MRPRLGSECTVRHILGSTGGQGTREEALHPRIGPCCPLTKGEGDGSVETVSSALPSSPSWDPERKEIALFFEVLGTTGRTEQKGYKRFSTRPSSGMASKNLSKLKYQLESGSKYSNQS